MRILALALSLLSLHAVPPQQVTWVQPNVAPSTAQVFVYTLSILEEGKTTPRDVGLLNVLCGGSETAAECSTVLPSAANAAIITGNVSRLTARDTTTNITSEASAPFVGDQGCIFRENLYAVGVNAEALTNKQNLTRVLMEFHAAKFKHVRTVDLKGNQFRVVEQCVGYLVQK